MKPKSAPKPYQTRRERFLFEMEQLVPWAALLEVIRPHYPLSGRRGRQPMPLATMLRIYCLQQWYALSDPAMEDALHEIRSLRRFAGLEAADAVVPDETTILKFRHLLEAHGLTAEILRVVNDELERRSVLLKGGTMVDATIIHAPSSTKNADKARDPEMRSTRKGKQWYFGMKAHVGVDLASGLVHTVSVTDAATADITELPKLLREDDTVVLADKAYIKRDYAQAAQAAGVLWGVPEKAPRGGKLTEAQQARNRQLSAWRAPVEHVFRVLKRQFSYVKTRYRGLKKNAQQLFALFALVNLYLARHALMA